VLSCNCYRIVAGGFVQQLGKRRPNKMTLLGNFDAKNQKNANTNANPIDPCTLIFLFRH